MSLPTLAKTWQFDLNQVITAQGTPLATNQKLLFTLKNNLEAFTNGWSCLGSSNSSVATNMSSPDNVDRWASASNLVWGANTSIAHSWIVLKQTNIATNFQILIDLGQTSASGNEIYVSISPLAGYTGGTTTTRPTATDEIVLTSSNNLNWGTASSSDVQLVLHVMQSTDGQCTRVAVFFNNICHIAWIFDKVLNPVSGWTIPFFAYATDAATQNTPILTYGNFYSSNVSSGNIKGKGPVTSAMTLFFTSESYNDNSTTNYALGSSINAPNDIDGNYPFFPIGLASKSTGNRGRHGQVFDLWWGTVGANSGDQYPGDASKTFGQIGNLIFPWNGSTMVTT